MITATSVDFGSERVRRVEAGPFAISLAAFPAHTNIPSHYHERGCVSLILEGRFLQRFPGRACDCPAGSVLAKPPGERHEDRWFARGSRHLIIEVDPARHEELGRSRAMVESVHHLPAAGAELFAARMLAELAAPDEVTPVSAEGLVLELLAFLYRRGNHYGHRARAPAWTGTVREYLHANFRQAVRLDELARLVSVHPDHLSRSFSARFGASIGEYLRRLRIEAAMAALVDTDEPIAAIAVRSGFSDQSHLTRLLRRASGVTPRAYRQAHRRASDNSSLPAGASPQSRCP